MFPTWWSMIKTNFFCNRTPEEVFAAKGVKPTLSPNLDTLALVEVNSSFFFDIAGLLHSLFMIKRSLYPQFVEHNAK